MQRPRPDERAVRAARELLGVAADAGPAQLARAYRSKARRLHPDVSLEPDATQRFWALEAAYHLALDAASDAVAAARDHAPTSTAVSTGAATTAPTRSELRDPTVLLGIPLTGDVPASNNDGRRPVPWLAAGPVRVQPPQDPVSRAAPPSSGEL
jgi:DnaJ domain